jgi:hypothetical protein
VPGFGRNIVAILWILFSVMGIGWLYGQCIETQAVGFIHDDGVYAILGKTLAVFTHPLGLDSRLGPLS